MTTPEISNVDDETLAEIESGGQRAKQSSDGIVLYWYKKDEKWDFRAYRPVDPQKFVHIEKVPETYEVLMGKLTDYFHFDGLGDEPSNG